MRSPRNLIIFMVLGLLLGAVIGYLAGNFRAEVPSFDADKLETEIIATMDGQVAAWNSGDIEGFMQDYIKSPKLRFASNDRVTRGWVTTMERYQSGYPDRATMGQLSFSDREVSVISPTAAVVFGRFTLTRAEDAPTGLFTLVMRKAGDDWLIVSDHTSTS
ncbi:YybH family protein [Litorimonas sp. RW-G-Af-16]|uniref:YybH family protein n=1 Tax=Litorimonas sp. RW-G-Af-16 TaxID=3241168 RepID=UPI00390C6E39